MIFDSNFTNMEYANKTAASLLTVSTGSTIVENKISCKKMHLLEEIKRKEVKQIVIDKDSGLKSKKEVMLIDLIRDIVANQSVVLAKISEPLKLTVEFQSMVIRGKD